ncbi:MAG: hypothetical protein CR982_08230 [Candidatus Cloacimonadota bacterium]|nr:MAG: hypothetical protein CR982_08230 [Candidatus Cloacimonadota bacterium]PIE77663.1 MAG: hypothetical protein CSA15_12130 [Candidatus Delongbacteria bacterium]
MEKHIISTFSAPDGTEIDNYKRFANLSAYIKERSEFLHLNSWRPPHLFPLMDACRCKRCKSEKFKARQKQWLNLNTDKIPLGYFDYIGATREKIEEAAKKDMDKFLYLAKQDLSPKYYTLRVMAGIYSGGKLPEGLTIDEAAEFVSNMLKEQTDLPLLFSFNFPELKTVFFDRERKKSIVWYVPEIKWKKDFLMVGSNGRLHGKCFL